MAEKHHYISQFHLRQFVDLESKLTPDPWLWVGELASKTVKRRAPKNLFWSRGMFDGLVGAKYGNVSFEKYLSSEIESPAASIWSSFCTTEQVSRKVLPPAILRYIAWAAARSLPMASIYQGWADETDALEGDVVEPPPPGWERMKMLPRVPCLTHPKFGIKENAEVDEVDALLERGWRLKFNQSDLLQIMHVQAWYFLTRFFPRLHWMILETPKGKSFVIADRPVVWGFEGAIAVKPSMFRHPAVQLFAPLSRSVALFAHHADSRPPDVILPEQVNAVMTSAARRWIAGADKDTVANLVIR